MLDGKQIFFCVTIGDIYKRFRALFRRPENKNVPYFIVQPRLANAKEYKVCILSNPFTGEVEMHFLCQNPHPKGKAFINPYDLSRLFEFTTRA